jgi:hypothetical protein
MCEDVEEIVVLCEWDDVGEGECECEGKCESEGEDEWEDKGKG